MDITGQLEKSMSSQGYKFKTVSIKHLARIQGDVGDLIRQGLIDNRLSGEWRFYLQTNNKLSDAATIIIAAMPEPIIQARFGWKGRIYQAEISPNYFYRMDESRAENLIRNLLEPAGFHVVKATLALKTLAVYSGLAKYGRNNLSYIEGFGSFFRLAAFYTDAPCEQDRWQNLEMMNECRECSLCRNSCPTGSITSDRFIIHAEKCLGFLNDKHPDIPYWVECQPDWRNAFIGYMQCQSVCPVNKPYMRNVIEGPFFSEEETGQILEATPVEKLSKETLKKLDNPSSGFYRLLPANLNALIEKQKKD